MKFDFGLEFDLDSFNIVFFSLGYFTFPGFFHTPFGRIKLDLKVFCVIIDYI